MDEDEQPSIPGGFTALAHAVLMPVREPRAMLVAIVLVAVLLAPVIPVVDGVQLEFVLVFVPFAIVPISFVQATRDPQRPRTALGYLLAMGMISALGSFGSGWTIGGALLTLASMPLLAVPIAYWHGGDLRVAISVVWALLRRRWKSTVLANVGSWQLIGALIVFPALAFYGADATIRELAPFVGLLSVGVALTATSYARIAMSLGEVERAQQGSTAAGGEAGDLEVGSAQQQQDPGADRERP